MRGPILKITKKRSVNHLPSKQETMSSNPSIGDREGRRREEGRMDSQIIQRGRESRT
jgi:hypothetical protein